MGFGHRGLLTSSWWQPPLLLHICDVNMKLTFLQQSVQFNCVPVNVCGRQSCSAVAAVLLVKSRKAGRPAGRSVHAPGWSLAAQHLATTLCVWMKVVWSSAERNRAFQTFCFPNWTTTNLHLHCFKWYIVRRVLGLSRRWRFKSRSSGLWRL